MPRIRWLAAIPVLLISVSALVSGRPSDVGSAGAEFIQPQLLTVFDEFLASEGIQKRAEPWEDCINLRDNVKAKDCTLALSTNGFKGAFYYDDDKKSHVSKDTVLSRDAVVTEITEAQATSFGKGKFTCDHIMELNILGTVVNYAGGACQKASELEDQVDAKARLDKIRKVVNRPENLVSFKSSVEKIKTRMAQRFQGKVVDIPGTSLTYLVMVDYLHKTLSKSRQTAKLLDDAIGTEFEGATTGVEAYWDKFIAFVELKATEERILAQKEIDKKKKAAEDKAKQAAARKANCGTPSAPSAPSRPGSPAPPAGKTRRGPRSAFYISSLERRAAARGTPAVRGAARSGPHAPAAPSCPLPGAPQKKVVPRSNMKTKPPPKKTPRAATAKPKAKPVKPKKVVARPPNRPRRAPGKAKPKKKVTPKKKPKKVPKPPKKPKGKPRPRRR